MCVCVPCEATRTQLCTRVKQQWDSAVCTNTIKHQSLCRGYSQQESEIDHCIDIFCLRTSELFEGLFIFIIAQLVSEMSTFNFICMPKQLKKEGSGKYLLQGKSDREEKKKKSTFLTAAEFLFQLHTLLLQLS